MDTFLTVTLGLRAEPGAVSQAASLWWALQRVARLTAEIDDAADWELLSKTDAVHRNAWISTQPRRIACARQISTWPFRLTRTQNLVNTMIFTLESEKRD